MKRAHFLFAALSFAWASAVAAPFEPVVSRTGVVRLFDPTQPMSTTNPVTVDSGLGADPPFGVLKKGNLSGGRLGGVENSLLGYLKGQQLFTPSAWQLPTITHPAAYRCMTISATSSKTPEAFAPRPEHGS